MSTTKKILLAAALCCIFGATSMFADTLTQTCVVSVTATSYTLNCPFTGFQTLDPGGTLQSVNLAISSVSGNVHASQSNNSPTTTFTFTNSTATIGMSFTGADTLSVQTTSTPSCSGSVNPNSVNNTCAATSFPAPTLTASSAGTTASYNVSGAVNFTASANIISAGGSGGAGSAGLLFFGGDGAIGGTLTITYTYSNAVPEPATMFLLGGALMGLGLVARKRKA